VLFAAVALAGIIPLFRLNYRVRSSRDTLFLLLLGMLLAVHWIAFFQSIKVYTVAIALLSYSTFPIFASLIEPFFFHERISIREIGLACLACVGTAVIIPSLNIEHDITRGVLWGILSGLTFAVLSILNRRYVRNYSGLTIALYEELGAAMVLSPLVFLIDFRLRVQDVALLIILGIVSTAVAHSLFIGGMRRVRARTAGLVAALEPVYGILFALVVLGERPSLRTLGGGMLILGAAVLATISSSHMPAPDS